MPRSPKPSAQPMGPQFPVVSPPDMLAGTELLQRQACDLEQIKQQLSTLGVTQEYSADAFESIAIGHIAIMRNSAMVLGGVLAAIRCQESAERWNATLERLGLSRSSAYRCIAVFARFTALPNLGALGSSKCIELLAVDDDTLRLIDAGDFAGLTAASLGEMSTRELRAEIRTLKEQAITKDKLLKAKQERIGELNDQLDLVNAERLERFSSAAQTISNSVNAALKALTKSEDQLLEFERLHEEMEAPQGVLDQIYGLREMLRERLTAVTR